MFMGIFNVTSTILAMCVIYYLRLKVVQSSDDFIAVFEGDTKDSVIEEAEKLRLHYISTVVSIISLIILLLFHVTTTLKVVQAVPNNW